MVKVYGYCITAVVLLCLVFSCYTLVKANKALTEENSKLKTTLEANLQATIDKEERNKDELERLQQTISDLRELNSSCLSDDVDDDAVKFLQQLQQEYTGTISFTFAE